MPPVSQAAARKRLVELRAMRAAERTPLERLSDLNPKQKAFIADVLAGYWCQVMCSRRAGKSFGICLALAILATRRKCNSIYIGLTAPAVKKTIWFEIWVPLVKKYCPGVRILDDGMITIFPNGSTVAFMGSDDKKYIETQLGASLTGLAIVDEGQSQAEEILTELIDVIIPPALSDDKGEGSGVLVISGTIPKIPYGRYWDDWKAESAIKKHGWNRFENGYLQNQEQKLDEFLARRPNLNRNSSVIQRDWYGVEVFDDSGRAWTGFVDKLYPEGNLYEGEPPTCDWHSGAADPGGHDEYAIGTIGWNDGEVIWNGLSIPRDVVWQVDEFTADENSKVAWSVAGAEIVKMDNARKHPPWVYDSNSKNTMDLLASDFGVVFMLPAEKSAFREQFDRANDLLAQRRFLVKKGSRMHRDFLLAQFNKKWLARQPVSSPWDAIYHGNQHDVFRYALDAYFNKREKEKKKLPKSAIELEKERLASGAAYKKQPEQRADKYRFPGSAPPSVDRKTGRVNRGY